MSTIDEILTRLYEKMGVSKDSEFCKKLDLKPSTVSSWRKRNSIPYEMIVGLSQTEDFSLDYVINGKHSKELNYKYELISLITKLESSQLKHLYKSILTEKMEDKIEVI